MITILFPCLNEQDAISYCIDNAREFIKQVDLPGEIIIIDNGSTDLSKEIALRKNVFVFEEPLQGYGSALRKGLSLSSGDYIIMADCDGSYDLLDAKPFINLLSTKSDLVIGSRLRGRIETGAMPWTHRYFGVPALSLLLRIMADINISDAHCGLRAIRREIIEKISFSCNGMEFASEMLLKAAQANLNITEVPISYKPRKGKSKLRTINDGFRHLFLITSYLPSLLK